MSALSLVIFDVDGTLVDSQAHILSALRAMFDAGGRPMPARKTLLACVGLSLPQFIRRLEPDLSAAEVEAWADVYRTTYAEERQNDVPPPLYDGALAALDRLARFDHVLLGVATGKSRRGVDHVLGGHGLIERFQTLQTADGHPSKPHPSMVEAALSETGLSPERAVIVGDTTFDIEMGKAAGIATIGVSWGYHERHALDGAGAGKVLDAYGELDGALADLGLVPR
ncbi:MAG: HAD-IA family hydrolase [Pseudomonadota bacterium]